MKRRKPNQIFSLLIFLFEGGIQLQIHRTSCTSKCYRMETTTAQPLNCDSHHSQILPMRWGAPKGTVSRTPDPNSGDATQSEECDRIRHPAAERNAIDAVPGFIHYPNEDKPVSIVQFERATYNLRKQVNCYFRQISNLIAVSSTA